MILLRTTSTQHPTTVSILFRDTGRARGSQKAPDPFLGPSTSVRCPNRGAALFQTSPKRAYARRGTHMHTNSAQLRYTSPPCLESESGRWGLFSVVFLLCELVLAHSGAFLPSGPYDPSEHSVPLHAEAPAGHPNAHVSPTIAHIACQASSPPDHSISRGSGWASSFPAHAPKKLKGETTQD